MLQTPTKVDAAFRELLISLEEEIAELKQHGTHLFHYVGAPHQAQSLLQRAEARTELRKQIVRLYEDWQSRGVESPRTLGIDSPLKRGAVPEYPGLIRHIKGISAPDAAKRLGVSEAKLRTLLEAGTLKGYRPTGGHWKITPADLMTFAREHRDLF